MKVKKSDGTRRCLTPPELAARWHCKPETVIAAIRRGELLAFNLASPGCRRPRYRISPEAIEEFERRRSVAVRTKIVRTRRHLPEVESFV